jgi:hypothetical protein
MSPVRLPLAAAGLAAVLLTHAAQPAYAEMRVGVREFVPADTASGNAAAGLHDMLFSDLAALILEAAGKQRCEIVILGVSDKMEEGRQLEKHLQEEGLIDPSTAVPVKPLEVNTLVDGVVRESADQISWYVEVSGADGAVITRDEGSVPVAERLSVTTKIAERLMSRLCPKKAWHLSARYNDLALDGVVCDIGKPFSVRGTGETAGIVFSFTPADQKGGTFTVGGTAGGVPWSGGGSYTVTVDGEGGSGNMPIVGSWQIKTPVGVFGDSGTIPGKLTAAPDCKAKDQAIEKPSAKKKKSG